MMTRRYVFETKTGNFIFVDTITLITKSYNRFTERTDYTVHTPGGQIIISEEEKTKLIQTFTYIKN